MSTRSKSNVSASRKDEIVIPDKLYFRIGEVARLTNGRDGNPPAGIEDEVMTVEYTNRWFRLSVEFFGIRSRPALRKYAIGYAEDSHEIKHRIVRSICAKVKANPGLPSQ